MSKKFDRDAARKKVFRDSIGGRRNTLGLFGYTPFSPGDDSYYNKSFRKFHFLILPDKVSSQKRRQQRSNHQATPMPPRRPPPRLIFSIHGDSSRQLCIHRKTPHWQSPTKEVFKTKAEKHTWRREIQAIWHHPQQDQVIPLITSILTL